MGTLVINLACKFPDPLVHGFSLLVVERMQFAIDLLLLELQIFKGGVEHIWDGTYLKIYC